MSDVNRWPEFTGLDLERHIAQLEQLRNSLPHADDFLQFSSSDLDDSKIPDEMDVKPFHRLEDQQRMGSCRAHSATSKAEWIHFIQTGQLIDNKTIQFSRQFAYNEIRTIDGIQGDQGCSMQGGIEFEKTIGHCLEEFFPYTGQDRRRSPRECFDNAIFKLRTHVILESYDDMWRFKAGRIGDTEIGMIWPDCMQSQRIIEDFWTGGRGAGRHAGGHAVFVGGWSAKKDEQGRHYFEIQNSWNVRNWQNSEQGTKLISPAAIEKILQHRFTVCIGSSNLENAEPQSWDFVRNPIFT